MLAHPFLKKDFEAREQFLQDRTALHSLLDSTLLKPDFLLKDIQEICQRALSLKVRAVCIPPSALGLAQTLLAGGDDASFSPARTQAAPLDPTHSSSFQPSSSEPSSSEPSPPHLCTVVGFPLGFQTTEAKCYEVKQALDAGVAEIDFVQNISLIKDLKFTEAFQEMQAIVKSSQNSLVKAIIETSLLTTEEIIRSCEICFEAGVHVIKTSTGFGSHGARVEDIEIIAHKLSSLESQHGRRLGIKASGGIRTLDHATAMIKAGACRIGTSQAEHLLIQNSNRP